MTPAAFSSLLVITAERFVGLAEGTQNATWDNPATVGSEKVTSDLLRKEMGRFGWTPGEPYCAAFAGAMVVLTAQGCGLRSDRFVAVWTPHCMTNVRKFTSLKLLDLQPSDASIFLMKHGSSDSGHAGICVRVEGKYPDRMLHTIEGNTMPGSSGDQRQGDGIYNRTRNVFTNGDLKTQGWVSAASILSLLDPEK